MTATQYGSEESKAICFLNGVALSLATISAGGSWNAGLHKEGLKAMDNQEKLQVLLELQSRERVHVDHYYEALEQIGNMKYHYCDYMTTEPIHCDKELKRLPEADYDLCCALLTMLLREDHFSNGSFDTRYEARQVQPILQRMIELLSAGQK